jgi:hypothetical protein
MALFHPLHRVVQRDILERRVGQVIGFSILISLAFRLIQPSLRETTPDT